MGGARIGQMAVATGDGNLLWDCATANDNSCIAIVAKWCL
jgi:hypothetical protein